MAAVKQNVEAQCRDIISDIRSGVFRSVYLLMGEEPYYPEMVCNEIIARCIDETSKDFNETVFYGPEVTAEQVITAARQFPVASDRVLVVVKEAQGMKTLEQLALYLENPPASTVLVILMHGSGADKRKGLYKTAVKTGAVIVDSPLIRDYEISSWISSYYSSLGLQIDPPAAVLLGESLGTDLSTIAAQTLKLRHNLAQEQTHVGVEDIERNVGVSRQFSIFELTKALSQKNAPECLKIASHIGSAAKFALPMAVSALFTHFSRILRYGALLSRGNVSAEDKAVALSGVNTYFYREYDQAVRNYPVTKAMAAVSLLCEYDYLGKGGNGAAISDGELLCELTAKLLNL